MRFKYLRRYQTDEMIINCSKWFHKYGIAQRNFIRDDFVGPKCEQPRISIDTVTGNVKKFPGMLCNTFREGAV